MVARLCVLLVAAAALMTGCAREFDRDTLERLRSADGEPIYWAGPSVDGHELRHAEQIADNAPPVDIQQWPLRERHPAQFDNRACRRLTVRGVPAAVFDNSGGALEVYTGSSVVVIFAASREQQRRVAAALRPINGSEGPGTPLPPPTQDVEAGLADCPKSS